MMKLGRQMHCRKISAEFQLQGHIFEGTHPKGGKSIISHNVKKVMVGMAQTVRK